MTDNRSAVAQESETLSFRVCLAGEETREFECLPEDSLLRAALRAGVALPYECNSGGCGRCQVELLSGDTEDLWSAAPGLSDRARRRGRRLACQTRALSDCSIKTRIPESSDLALRPTRRKARLLSRHQIAHDLMLMRFETDRPADFSPGQYALLSLPGVSGDRAYSMCNLPNQQGEWAFVVKRAPHGTGSRVLFETLQIGSELELDGPFGHAYLDTAEDRDIVCIGGGSGISPLLAILSSASNNTLREASRLTLLYGARKQRDLFDPAFLRQMGIASDRVHFQACLSEENDESDWNGARGFIHELLARKLAENSNPENSDYYFCGPPAMIDAVNRLLLVDNRVASKFLHVDRFY